MQVAQIKKSTGVAKPFPFVEMDLFIPSWAVCGSLAEAVPTPSGGQRKKPDMVKWLASIDAAAVAMDVLDLMPYCTCMAHKRNCMWVAQRARAGKDQRGQQLGQYYDEVCRREWGSFHSLHMFVSHCAFILLQEQWQCAKTQISTSRKLHCCTTLNSF